MSDISYSKQLMDHGRSVYSVTDMGKIWNITNESYLRVLISRMIKRGDLIKISQGLYTWKNVWNRWELANKYKTPSYVSLESVLYKNGVIFQDYSKIITSVSTNSLRKKVADVELIYSKVKLEILSNPLGITNENGVMVASVERAACDMIYLSPNFYFDNKEKLDYDNMLYICKIYNMRVIKEVAKLCSR